jgi:peptide/nickel transport system substrate-binding protein
MRKLCFISLVIMLLTCLVINGCSKETSPAPPTSTLPGASAPAPASASPATSVPAATSSPSTSSTGAPAEKPRSGGTLRWIAGVGPGTPIGIPWEASGGAAVTMQVCLEPLVKTQLDGTITPCLASSYDPNPDPSNPSITFHLQKGVKFSDGADFNAQAVKWNLEQEMVTGSTNIGSTTSWKSIEVIDDNTVRVNMKKWQSTLIEGFAGSAGFLISPASYEKKGLEWMRWNMVGTGPFVQTDFQKDVSMTAVKNQNYWQPGKPYLDGLKLIYANDIMTCSSLMQSGGADVLNCQGNAKVANDIKAAGFKILVHPASGTNSLAPDSLNADSPWSNVKVRQAAEYAIDREAISAAFGFGYSQPIYQLLGSFSPAYDASLTPRKYNVATAKRLLAEANYPEGFKTTMIVAPFGLNKDIVMAIQDYFSAVNIQCEMQFPESSRAMQYLTGPSPHNALIYNPIMMLGSAGAIYNFYLAEPKATWYQSMKHPDGWADMLNAFLGAAKADPALAQKCEGALYNDATLIPVLMGAAPYATTNKVHDSGIGTRISNTYWNPESAWLSP